MLAEILAIFQRESCIFVYFLDKNYSFVCLNIANFGISCDPSSWWTEAEFFSPLTKIKIFLL